MADVFLKYNPVRERRHSTEEEKEEEEEEEEGGGGHSLTSRCLSGAPMAPQSRFVTKSPGSFLTRH